jgi:hypothetical protein
MQLPTIPTTLYDEKLNFTFQVLAYRTLTAGEMRAAWAYYRSQKKSAKPKKNQTVQVISQIGIRGR